jgi:hypothetical protein
MGKEKLKIVKPAFGECDMNFFGGACVLIIYILIALFNHPEPRKMVPYPIDPQQAVPHNRVDRLNKFSQKIYLGKLMLQ